MRSNITNGPFPKRDLVPQVLKWGRGFPFKSNSTHPTLGWGVHQLLYQNNVEYAIALSRRMTDVNYLIDD